MLIIIVHGWTKIHASICKIKARGLDLVPPPNKNFIADRSLKLHSEMKAETPMLQKITKHFCFI